jgi:DNA adenine methylase
MNAKKKRSADAATSDVAASPAAASPPTMVDDGQRGYPGSKGGSGVAERIIRQMPPHRVYVEGFAGHAAVFRKKAPADLSILIDADPLVCDWLQAFTTERTDTLIKHADFLQLASSLSVLQDPTTLVYLDAPYLLAVRTRLLYDREFETVESHTALLTLVQTLPCMVMVSHCWNPLYMGMLDRWRVEKIPAMTHGGKRIEHLWCNFEEPSMLHDPRFAGGKLP